MLFTVFDTVIRYDGSQRRFSTFHSVITTFQDCLRVVFFHLGSFSSSFFDFNSYHGCKCDSIRMNFLDSFTSILNIVAEMNYSRKYYSLWLMFFRSVGKWDRSICACASLFLSNMYVVIFYKIRAFLHRKVRKHTGKQHKLIHNRL